MAYNLEKEEDVKQYIENLGIEYRFSCYHERNAEGCHLLGDYMEAIKKQFDTAASIYKMNCDKHNFGKSCNKFGGYRANGKGCTKNQGDALEYFKKGCELECPEACFGAGVLESSRWEDHKPDFETALKYLEPSCDGRDSRACFHASGIYFKGMGSVPVNLQRAFEFAEKGCALRDPRCCANLSIMYSQGEGVAKNAEMAEKYKKIALEIQEQLKGNFAPIEFS